MSVGAELVGRATGQGGGWGKKASLAYNLSGNAAADAAAEAAKTQESYGNTAIGQVQQGRDEALKLAGDAGTQSIGYSQPYNAVGMNAIPAYSDILTTQGQQDYLRNNPLFQIGMDKLDRMSNNTFLGRGQVGSANNQIVQNAFLAGQPLLQQQTTNLQNAVAGGQTAAAGEGNAALTTGLNQANIYNNAGTNIADITTGIGNSKAAGTVGGANARQAGATNFLGSTGSIFGALSDRRLKRNISAAPDHGAYKTYIYQYLWSDDWYRGVMADEVKIINPGAVYTNDSGYDVVNYGAL